MAVQHYPKHPALQAVCMYVLRAWVDQKYEQCRLVPTEVAAPCANNEALPVLYWVTLCIWCFWHCLPLQKARFCFGTFTCRCYTHHQRTSFISVKMLCETTAQTATLGLRGAAPWCRLRGGSRMSVRKQRERASSEAPNAFTVHAGAHCAAAYAYA
jgi:hypothetical protein